ncbi:MAG: family ATPase [Marmoricola sp.]|nr:family ATPase [Marmoricola sp.]
MSTPVDSPAGHPGSGPASGQHPERPSRRVLRPRALAGARDALVVAVWFAVMGAIGAVVWWQVTPLPEVTKSGGKATLAPDELVKQVNIDGWFFVIAAIGGLASAVILMAWRRRDPLVMVLLVALGGALAAWVMIRVGLALGPPSELTALRSAPDGARVPMQLKLHAPGMAWVWPLAAVFGAAVHLWVLKKPDPEHPPADTLR